MLAKVTNRWRKVQFDKESVIGGHVVRIKITILCSPSIMVLSHKSNGSNK